LNGVQTKGISFRFSEALVRRPGKSVVNGLSSVNRGRPDVDLFQAEHQIYISALEQAGLKVTVLPPLEAFPDSVFIEDTALCLPQGTVILHPGTPSRSNEAGATATTFSSLEHKTQYIGPQGHGDGGDILVTDSVILVGLSHRTDRTGYEDLKAILNNWDYKVRAVHTPENVLHFKSDCCVLDSETVLATSRLSGAECFTPFRVLVVPAGEEAAANAIRVNDTVLLSAGFPATADLIARENYQIELVPTSQAALLDGGLSCLSLRFG
jgi:dimethylargininase